MTISFVLVLLIKNCKSEKLLPFFKVVTNEVLVGYSFNGLQVIKKFHFVLQAVRTNRTTLISLLDNKFR